MPGLEYSPLFQFCLSSPPTKFQKIAALQLFADSPQGWIVVAGLCVDDECQVPGSGELDGLKQLCGVRTAASFRIEGHLKSPYLLA